MRVCSSGFLFLLAASASHALLAQTVSFNFENLGDSALLTNQYAGATFANTIILSAGITLDELELPPRSGSSVASDNGGPITITFATPLRSFLGYFTYNTPLSLQALDASNTPLASTSSAFSNNEALSGAQGSKPGELLQVSSSFGIYKIVITGGAHGSSFTLDDVVLISRCDVNQDGVVDVGDTQTVVNQALGIKSPTGDLTADSTVNVVDVQIVVNAALNLGCSAK